MNRLVLIAMFMLPAIALAAPDALEHAAADHASAPHAAKPTPFAGTIAQSIAAILVFFIVFFVLRAKAWGPILKGLNDREDRIRRDLESADAAHRDAQASLENYKKQIANADTEVRQRLAAAQKDAEFIGTQLKMQAQTEIEEMKARATTELEAAKQGALSEMHDYAATLATSVAEKILRRNVNQDDQRAMVQSSLEQLQTLARN